MINKYFRDLAALIEFVRYENYNGEICRFRKVGHQGRLIVFAKRIARSGRRNPHIADAYDAPLGHHRQLLGRRERGSKIAIRVQCKFALIEIAQLALAEAAIADRPDSEITEIGFRAEE